MTTGTVGQFIMDPPMSTMVAGALATTWRPIAVVSIVKLEKAATLRKLTDPRLLPAQCRLFRRNRVLVARILVARDHIEVRPGNDFESLSGKLLNDLNYL